jgi:uncharacterized protein
MFHVKPGCARPTWNRPPAAAHAAGAVRRAAVDLLLLVAPAFAAGFVDAVVGGGGLIRGPALFAACPRATPRRLLGTNKLSSMAGTTASAVRYSRRIALDPRVLVPAPVGATLFSPVGARLVTGLPRDAVRPLMLVRLIVVAGHTFLRKDFGRTYAPRLPGHCEPWAGFAAGAVLGFCDGLFGPGPGAFLIFMYVRGFGREMLTASTSAKVVNVGTNLAALAFFAATGQVLSVAGALMAAAEIAGGSAGTGVALARGAGIVRSVFLVVVTALIAKLGWDLIAGWGLLVGPRRLAGAGAGRFHVKPSGPARPGARRGVDRDSSLRWR